MMDEQPPHPVEPESAPPPEIVQIQAVPQEPERYPFWGYFDVFLFAGMAIPAMLLGLLVVKGLFALLHFHPERQVIELLAQQLIGYALLFAALVLIFKLEYERGFWDSLAWFEVRLPMVWMVIAGLATAFSVAFLASLIHTPTTKNPMTELMQDRFSIILMAVFGVTVAPMAEELAFRGLLQPLFVRSLGVVPGIIAAAIPFGLLHYREYGNSWRHAVLIALAGAAFGAMRQATGSTRASTLMHASYNALIFLVVLVQGKDLPHP